MLEFMVNLIARLIVVGISVVLVYQWKNRNRYKYRPPELIPNPPLKTPHIVYLFDFGDGYAPISLSEAIKNPSLIIDHYQNLDDAVAGGYVIKANGEVVFEIIDQTNMSESWIPAINRLMKGENNVWLWAYEESNMTLTLHGDQIELIDGNACPQTRFLFHEFVREMLEASRPLKEFIPKFEAAVDCCLENPEYRKDKFVYENLKELREAFDPQWIEQFDECEQLFVELNKE